MSKLSDRINSIETNDRRAIQGPILFTTEDFTRLPEFPLATRYMIGVELRADAWIVGRNQKDLPAAMARVKQMMIHEVFGEFRDPLFRIEHALFERDTEKALDLLDQLRRQMYDV